MEGILKTIKLKPEETLLLQKQDMDTDSKLIMDEAFAEKYNIDIEKHLICYTNDYKYILLMEKSSRKDIGI